jgi:hypothetical protein
MLNITLQFTDLQCPLDVVNLQTAIPHSNPQIANNTHRSPGPGGPFSVWLRPGSSWYSPANAFRLTLQATDGNLVLECINDAVLPILPVIGGASDPINPNNPNTALWAPVWSPHIQGKGVTEVDFQIDGNLVAYAGSQAVFATGTNLAPGTSDTQRPTLYLQDDGNLVIYTLGPVARFATNTSVLETPGKNT